MIRIGAIGYGLRINNLFTFNMEPLGLGAKITAVVDPDEEGVRAKLGDRVEGCTFYPDVETMLAEAQIDAVMLGTHCKYHAELATKVLKSGLPLFLEKPVGITEEDLDLLEEAGKNSKSKVVVSFPLRFTPIVQTVQDIIKSGRIGEVAQVQIYNNVNYGDVYFQSWYRDAEQTGGLFLQKATHDLDYVNMLLETVPEQLAALKTRTFFKADHPDDLRCEDCAERETCVQGDFYKKHYLRENPSGPMCAYSEGCKNEDSASVMVLYKTGIHGVYTQNFFAKQSAHKRGARLIGTKGMVEFDFYTDEIFVTYHYSTHTERHKVGHAGERHFGGDTRLSHHFLNVVRGLEESKSTLQAGILSARMCLAARKSSETLTFQQVKIPEGK